MEIFIQLLLNMSVKVFKSSSTSFYCAIFTSIDLLRMLFKLFAAILVSHQYPWVHWKMKHVAISCVKICISKVNNEWWILIYIKWNSNQNSLRAFNQWLFKFNQFINFAIKMYSANDIFFWYISIHLFGI